MVVKRKYTKPDYSLLFMVSGAFFCFFLFGNHHLSEDWLSYYSLSVIREPGYALFVRGFIDLLGEEMGIHGIALVQNLLAAFGVYAFSAYFGHEIWSKGRFLSAFPLPHKQR